MQLRDTVLRISTKRLGENFDAVKALVGKDVKIMAVVKANGYGHGICEVACVFYDHGASHLAVATLSEALALRSADPTWQILILGHTPDRLLPIVVENNLTQTLFSSAQAEILDRLAAQAHTKMKVHLKVDSGFHRLGTDEVDELEAICRKPNLITEGIYTHLALAGDDEDYKQMQCFLSITEELKRRGCEFAYRHAADSICTVESPQYRLDMIRPGALLYGMKGYSRGSVDVKQALRFETRISALHRVAKGEGAGYDYLWRAKEDSLIATLPFGYADGYPRCMREGGYVSIQGVKCPIAGVICMDQCMVDVSAVPDVHSGDEAVIYGDGTDGSMTIAEAALIAKTNKNEILSRLSLRVPRIYS